MGCSTSRNMLAAAPDDAGDFWEPAVDPGQVAVRSAIRGEAGTATQAGPAGAAISPHPRAAKKGTRGSGGGGGSGANEGSSEPGRTKARAQRRSMDSGPASGTSSSRSGGSSQESGSGRTPDGRNEFFGLDLRYSDMELRESIGSGTYGQVFKCRYKGKMFALKKIFMPETPMERAEMLEDFAKEVGILSVLRHERIVSFKGAVRTHPTYALLFELCEGCVGTLLRMVRRRKVQVTWSICVTIAKDCAEAVAHLHSLRPRIIHRDLKAENLLLTSRFRCKLTDFGLSRVYEGRKRTMTVCGTPCWVAPEIFRGEPYNEKIDVYSFGVVLWELFAGRKPYTEYESVELPYRVGKKGLRPPLLRHCPPSINRLMKDCWNESAAMRPTLPEIHKRLAAIENELELAHVINSPAHQTKVSWAQQVQIQGGALAPIAAAGRHEPPVPPSTGTTEQQQQQQQKLGEHKPHGMREGPTATEVLASTSATPPPSMVA